MNPAAPDPLLDRVLGGKYTLVERLGAGGFGAVYRAIQAPVGRVVAVKVIRQHHEDAAEFRRRFALEARALARVSSHPNAAAFIDYGEAPDGLLYMVQAFVEGQTLQAVLNADGQLPAARAVLIAGAVLDALDVAHHHGIVHRDIKPANVMVSRDHRGREQVKLLDFGIAQVVGEARGDISPTATGVIIGTPHYMAPEQFIDEPITARCDVYAVGVLLYHMLAGLTPFAGSALALMQQHINTPPPALPAGAAPVAVERAVMKALAKAPADRFADAAAFRAALDGALDGPAAPKRRWVFVAASGLLVATAFAAYPVLWGPPVAEGREELDGSVGADAIAADVGAVRDGMPMDSASADATPQSGPLDVALSGDAPADAAVTDGMTRADAALAPRPTSPRRADIERRFRAALAACDCAAAARMSAAWEAPTPMPAALRALYTERCRVLGQGCLEGR